MTTAARVPEPTTKRSLGVGVVAAGEQHDRDDGRHDRHGGDGGGASHGQRMVAMRRGGGTAARRWANSRIAASPKTKPPMCAK